MTRLGDTALLRFPAVRFRTRAGAEVEFQNAVGSSPLPYRVGQRVPVRYDPDDPRKASIRSFTSLWFFCAFPALAGVLAGCLGAGLLLMGLLALALSR